VQKSCIFVFVDGVIASHEACKKKKERDGCWFNLNVMMMKDDDNEVDVKS